METYVHLTVKIICAVYVLYRCWIFIFSHKTKCLWRRVEIIACYARRKNAFHKGTAKKQKESTSEKSVPEVDVMGKTKTVYIENPDKARNVPAMSEPLPESDFIGEDDDISADDVEDNLESLEDEELLGLMSPSVSEPDPDFKQSMTFEDMQNVADVLSGKNDDDSNAVRAAETLYAIRQSDIFEFFLNETGNKDKVENLLRECLDENGVPRDKPRQHRKEAEGFDWDKYV